MANRCVIVRVTDVWWHMLALTQCVRLWTVTPLDHMVDEQPSKVIPVLLLVEGTMDDGVIQQRRD